MARDDLTILLVDDDDIFLDIAAMAIESLGHRVVPAASGPDALPLVEAEAVDLLITDANLTAAMDGYALATRIRETRPALPVIYISGDRSLETAPPGAPPGTFLPKPVPLETLEAAISQACLG